MYWFGMSSIQVVGDSFRMVSLFLLIGHILFTRSCKGLSLKTQVLLFLVYTIRSFDLIDPSYSNSTYAATLKIASIVLGLIILFLFAFFWKSYQYKKDTFWMESLLILCLVLSGFYNQGFTVSEIGWSFSKFLDAVAIVPQLYMHAKTGESKYLLLAFTTCLSIYKGCYLIKWFKHPSHPRLTNPMYITVAGCIQFVSYVLFGIAIILKCEKKPTDEDKKPKVNRKTSFKNLGTAIQLHFSHTIVSDKQITAPPIFTVLPPDVSELRSTVIVNSDKENLLSNKY